MRALTPLQVAVAAVTLLAAWTPTGPGHRARSEILVLAVRQSSATIDGGAFVQLTATALGDDKLVTAPLDISWSSSDPTTARVGVNGLVEGRRGGEVRINSAWQNAHGSAWVKVSRAQKPSPVEPACMKRLPVPVKDISSDPAC